MEEDIKKIQERIIEPFYDFPNPISIELKDTDVELIENLIKRNKELEESNHNLLLIVENSILKSKVRDMIKELERIKYNALTDTTVEIMNYKIDILELILREGDK